MPKSREYMSSSDSSEDNSSSDEKPKKKKLKREEVKKDKEEVSEKPKSSKTSNNDDEVIFELGSMKQVTVRDFKGKIYVDLRNMYLDKNGDKKPTKKGISLSIEQWKKLVDVMEDVNTALKSK